MYIDLEAEEVEDNRPTTAGRPKHADDVDDDEGDQSNDDLSGEEEEEDTASMTARAKKTAEHNPHCNINFVIATNYKLLISDSETTVFADGFLLDPSPKVPSDRSLQFKSGDYVLLRGGDITLKQSYKKTTFEAAEEYILRADWTEFDGDMTGEDLAQLGDTPFLLWWQNIKPPTVPTKKRAAAPKTKKRRKA